MPIYLNHSPSLRLVVLTPAPKGYNYGEDGEMLLAAPREEERGLAPPGGGGTQVLNDYRLPNGRAERRR